MPSNDFGNPDFGYSDTGIGGAGYQPAVPGQGSVQDSPPSNYASPPGQEPRAGHQAGPGQFNPQGNQNQPGYQPPPGSFNYQVGQGQYGYQGNPGPFGQGQSGYTGTPTPIGYQSPSQFGQQPYGNNQMWGAAGAGLGGGIGRVILGILAGPGTFRRRGRNRYFWYIRIAFWLIVIGICLYVGFTKHTWITTCTGDCGGD